MQEHCGLIKINVTAAFKDTENSAQLSSDGGKTQTDATTTTCRLNVMRPNAQVIVYLGCYIVTRASTLAAVVEVKLLVQICPCLCMQINSGSYEQLLLSLQTSSGH